MPMLLTNFNFAQPWWLSGLILIPLGWVWNKYWRKKHTKFGGLDKFIDAKLLPHLIAVGQQKSPTKNIGLIYSALVCSIIIALANPRWSYKEFEAFQPTASMVVLMDLSSTMNADDISPTRIVRARQILEDLLNLSQRLKIGLIGFAGNPHLISPISDDINTIKNYVAALDTDLTNMQGNSLAQSLRMAAELLAREPGEKKSILLLSAGDFMDNTLPEQISKLSSMHINLHVIGIGTETGAPYMDNNGVLHKSKGKIVTSKLNVALLKEIAQRGHGIYTQAATNDNGLRAILRKAEQTPNNAHLSAGKIRQWNDQYSWFVLIAAGLFLYLMQQRVLYVMFIFIGLGLNSSSVQAMTWRELFVNANMRGQEAYVTGNFNEAAQIFTDAYNKGVALYRDGQFAQAEQAFQKVQSKKMQNVATYNAGNAQMQQRKWSEAIDSYESVLANDPDNFAAQHNLEIARRMLEKEPKKNQDPDCECKNPKKNKDNGKQKPDQSNSNKKDSQQEQAEQKQQDPKDTAANKQQNKQQQENKDQQQSQQEQNPQNKQDAKTEQTHNDAKNDTEQAPDKTAASAMQHLNYDKAQVDQLLHRVDGDIKVFLKNKFYIEDILSAQDK